MFNLMFFLSLGWLSWFYSNDVKTFYLFAYIVLHVVMFRVIFILQCFCFRLTSYLVTGITVFDLSTFFVARL